MKTKAFEILIVILSLLVIAFFAGCKDEEPEPNKTKRINVDAVSSDWSEPNNPDVGYFSFSVDKSSMLLNKPLYVYEYEDGSRMVLSREPNEPKYSYSITVDPNWEYSTCSGCGAKSHISESHYCLSQFIPTWPDYIELEKDLVIDNRGELRWQNDYYIISKGTKIYFKE